MNWAAATAWADNLVYGGYSDWRLPTLNPADTTCSSTINGISTGTGCTGGELSGLFVTDLGNKANQSVLNQVGDTAEQIANLALFSNVQSYVYWSGTEFAPNPASAWFFFTLVGSQFRADKSSASYAVAVRSGNVTAANNNPVPEPQTLALLGLGLLGLAATRRRG